MDSNKNVDPIKLDIVSRLGLNWYGQTTENSLFEITKPIAKLGVGFDKLPQEIINSKIFTDHELAILASVDSIPTQKNKESLTLKSEEKHILAKKLLKQDKVMEAWQILI